MKENDDSKRFELIERKFLSLQPFRREQQHQQVEKNLITPDSSQMNQYLDMEPHLRDVFFRFNNQKAATPLKLKSRVFRKPENRREQQKSTVTKLPSLSNFKTHINNKSTREKYQQKLNNRALKVKPAQSGIVVNNKSSTSVGGNTTVRKSLYVGGLIVAEPLANSKKDLPNDQLFQFDKNEDEKQEDEELVYYDTSKVWEYILGFDLKNDEFEPSRCELEEVKLSMAHAQFRESNDTDVQSFALPTHQIPYKTNQIARIYLLLLFKNLSF